MPGGTCAAHSDGAGKKRGDHSRGYAGDICDHGVDVRIYELFCISASGPGNRGGAKGADKGLFAEKYSAVFRQQRNTEIRKRESCLPQDSLFSGMKGFIFYRQMRAGRLYLWEHQQFPE